MRQSIFALVSGLLAMLLPVQLAESCYAAGSVPARAHPCKDQATLLQQANSLAAHGQWESAAKIYQQLVTTTKANATTHHMYGRTLALMKKFTEASQQYRQALSLDPSNVEIMNDLGVVLAATENHAEAKDLFMRATALNDKYLPAYNNLGSLLVTMRDYGHAIPILEYSLALQPKNTAIRRRLNEALRKIVDDGVYETVSEPFDGAGLLTPSTEQEDPFNLDAALVNKNLAPGLPLGEGTVPPVGATLSGSPQGDMPRDHGAQQLPVTSKLPGDGLSQEH